MLKSEAGYSLVEVMVSIMILAVAIIPMVAMFDMGLNAATTSGNYDTARAFANKKLEEARSLPYTDLRDKFPGTSNTTPGTYGPINSATEAGVPSGFSYTARKRYKCVSSSSISCTAPTGPTSVLANSGTDQGIVEVTVTVSWSGGRSYSATQVIGNSAL